MVRQFAALVGPLLGSGELPHQDRDLEILQSWFETATRLLKAKLALFEEERNVNEVGPDRDTQGDPEETVAGLEGKIAAIKTELGNEAACVQSIINERPALGEFQANVTTIFSHLSGRSTVARVDTKSEVRSGTLQGRDADPKIPAKDDDTAGPLPSAAPTSPALKGTKLEPAEVAELSPAARLNDTRAVAWEAIEIVFISDERVQISNGTNSETCNYAELGFADGRSEKPIQAWETLRTMAEQGGVIANSTKPTQPWSAVEKRIQEIRRALQRHFGLSADPIRFSRGTGYEACFKIRCGPSFRT
jgi:hypothetical protein